MSDLSKIWTTVGSAGILNQADLAKVTFHQSIIQLGVDIVAPNPVAAQEATAQPASGAAPILSTIKAVARYNVTPVDGLFMTGLFVYALQIRFRGHVVAKLIEVNLGNGVETQLVLFDNNNPTPNFQVTTAGATPPSTTMDFVRHAYYVEATLIASALVAGHPAEISIIKILATPTIL